MSKDKSLVGIEPIGHREESGLFHIYTLLTSIIIGKKNYREEEKRNPVVYRPAMMFLFLGYNL